MFETMVLFTMGDHLYGETYVPARAASVSRLMSPERRPYKTADGLICCLIYTDPQWKAFLKLIGRPELFATDPRFAEHHAAHGASPSFTRWSPTAHQAADGQWQALLKAADIPTFPTHDFASLVADPHLKDIGFFSEVDHPLIGRIRQMNVPSEWSATPPSIRRQAPTLGQHSREVLREAGLSRIRASTTSSRAGRVCRRIGRSHHVHCLH
ncbi:MAG: CoA transferase [Rubrivivax sp.]